MFPARPSQEGSEPGPPGQQLRSPGRETRRRIWTDGQDDLLEVVRAPGATSGFPGPFGRRGGAARHDPPAARGREHGARCRRRELRASWCPWMNLSGYVVVGHGHSQGDTFWVISAHIVGMYGLVLVVGDAIDHVGRRPALIGGLLVMGVFDDRRSLWIASLPAMSLALFGLGLGWAFSYVAATTELVDRAALSERRDVSSASPTCCRASRAPRSPSSEASPTTRSASARSASAPRSPSYSPRLVNPLRRAASRAR